MVQDRAIVTMADW